MAIIALKLATVTEHQTKLYVCMKFCVQPPNTLLKTVPGVSVSRQCSAHGWITQISYVKPLESYQWPERTKPSATGRFCSRETIAKQNQMIAKRKEPLYHAAELSIQCG
ncbi:hypothetical protein MRX96_011390 [Rhipicephalus microplus]